MLKETLQNAAMRGFMSVVAGIEKMESGIAFNPLDPKNLDNPYPFYHRLREKDPVHRSRVGPWIVSRYADAIEVFGDKRLSNDLRNSSLWPRMHKLQLKAGRTQYELDNPEMLHSDPPRHTRLRALVSQAFTPVSVGALAPRIQQVVHDLLDRAERGGTMDLITGLAHPLPVIVIAEMLGIRAEDRDQFRRWSDDILRGYGYPNLIDLTAAVKAEREYQAYLTKIIEQRRKEPQDDLITRLVQAEEQGDRLSMHELFSICTLLLVGGNETTANLLGNGILALLQNLDQWELLRSDPCLAEPAVEELLRYDSPIVVDGRFAMEPFEFKGRQIKKGQTLLLLVGAINRDPAQFEEPDRLNLKRENNRHLAFGRGIHYCIGAPLTRLETAIALRILTQRYPNLRLAKERVKRIKGNWGLRGLVELPVRA
jgi:pimeloyl-[acyl-carrier protein] synthase